MRRVNTAWDLDNAMVKCIIKFKKIYRKKDSVIGLRIIVNLGPTHYSKGPVQCSGAWTWVVPHIRKLFHMQYCLIQFITIMMAYLWHLLVFPSSCITLLTVCPVSPAMYSLLHLSVDKKYFLTLVMVIVQNKKNNIKKCVRMCEDVRLFSNHFTRNLALYIVNI